MKKKLIMALEQNKNFKLKGKEYVNIENSYYVKEKGNKCSNLTIFDLCHFLYNRDSLVEIIDEGNGLNEFYKQQKNKKV